ncbi:MAG: DUF2865 domain-containing protein [Roseiarcus sp.]|jgi:hypothetical protein
MRDPREHRFPDRARISSGWAGIRNAARRHPSAAFVAAPAIILAGALLLASGLAWASGRERVWAPVVDIAAPDVAAPTAVDVQTDQKPKETRANGLAVCVRLCDGFFFPSATSSGGDEACAAQCPDAPTARYTEPAGSDRIEDAVSTRGALYSALPVANRYRTTFDNTCSCRHSLIRGYSASALTDPTLRKGDLVMTSKGFLVFLGAKARSVAPSDFVALSQARSLPKDLRTALVAMESASALQRQVGAAPSLGASFSANPDKPARRLQGSVTMIDAPSKLSVQ